MKRSAWVAVTVSMVVLAAACGSGKKIGGGVAPGSTVAPGAPTTSDVCKTTTLQSTEVGVSPRTITVTVIADTGSPLRPGLFQGSVDAVQAWAKYINANGGLACRQVVVKTADSKLTADDARNAVDDRVRRLARDGGHDRAVPRRHDRGRAVQGQDGKAGRHSRPRGHPDVRGRAVLADLVRGASVRRVVSVQRKRRADVQGSDGYPRLLLQEVRQGLVARRLSRSQRPAVDDLGDRRRCSRSTRTWASSRTPSSA